MQIIPIQDVYSQSLTVQIGGQNTQINLYQKLDSNLYCDVYVNNSPIITGVICRNMNLIVRDAYLGFIGDLMFVDQQGTFTPPSTGIDPSSPGLGTRFLFCYLTTTDLAD
ncbi:hypothetical protein [Paraburkholderia unamae]|uniref:Cyanophage baseplate Pam3 plug gp18 domain-containing protein n=1 Tax=Paraburkholderia unamae TaxID=219649 RepID=A0ABX5K6R8_9BURK|nr:hypothetical protein [Paraburkholderia unamae]PVX61231.1 hypothetical protein C7402_14222 [Paraburkholderia unamae]